MKGSQNITGALFDDNADPILLEPVGGGKLIGFERVAVVRHKDNTYCILKPLEDIADVADDEAIVYRIDMTDTEQPRFMIEEDFDTSAEVFLKYYDMLENELKRRIKI